MHTLDGPTLDYYYDALLSWYEVRSSTADRESPGAVPEPSTVLLYAPGLALTVIAAFGARARRLKGLGKTSRLA